MHKTCVSALLGAFLLTCPAPVLAQFDSGSDGSDGPFEPQTNITIDLNDTPEGIFNYTTINIPAGVTVRFRINARNTPVVWLASEDVTIEGTIFIEGANGDTNSLSIPGPGGGNLGAESGWGSYATRGPG